MTWTLPDLWNVVSNRTDGQSFWREPLAKRERTYTQKQGKPVSELIFLVSDSLNGTIAALFVQS